MCTTFGSKLEKSIRYIHVGPSLIQIKRDFTDLAASQNRTVIRSPRDFKIGQ